MNVAVIQLQAGDHKTENIKKAAFFVEQAIQNKAEFICLPEVFSYRGKAEDGLHSIAEDVPGESLRPLSDLAKKKNVFILAGSIYERAPSQKKVYNTSVLIDDRGRAAAQYRKIHLFNAVLGTQKICESDHFLSGKKTSIVKVKDFMVGLSICYDVRFPELYKLYARQGADVLCVPSAFTYKTGEAHWEVLLRARAIENVCYVLAPNQIGEDNRGIRVYGNSMIIDPWGNMLARASSDKEEIIYARLDKNIIKEKRLALPGFGKI